MQIANAAAESAITIYVAAGHYSRNQGMFTLGSATTKDLNIIATGGRAVFSMQVAVSSWTLDGAGTYRAVRGGILTVLDHRYKTTRPDGFDEPSQLIRAASLAACQATPGSWWQAGSDLWVHCQDDRMPDAGAGQDVRVCQSVSEATYGKSGGKIFMRGIDIEGATAAFLTNPTSTNSVAQAVYHDCRAWGKVGGVTFKSFNAVSCDLAIYSECAAYSGDGDGFSSARTNVSSPTSKVIEIDCRAFNHGLLDTVNTNINGSTSHDDCKVLRVNTWAINTKGPVIHDVGSVKSWNLGVIASNCTTAIGASPQDSKISAGLVSATTTEMWLDGCTTSGAGFYDVYAGVGCTVRYARMAAPAVSAGTVDAYTP
jgi:hypothetical protein